jgi:hypothetical protein
MVAGHSWCVDCEVALSSCSGHPADVASCSTSRDLSGLSLDGELPFDTSVWQPLNSLTSVNLANNNLSGFLPPQISELTNATSLNLGGNSFAGGL